MLEFLSLNKTFSENFTPILDARLGAIELQFEIRIYNDNKIN